MPTLEISTTGLILDSGDIVNLTISPVIQKRTFRSYGYGQFQDDLSMSYFDAFDLFGELTGVFDDPDNVGILDGEYGYGWGFEYTSVIRQNADELEINLAITPAGVYDVMLQADGPGQVLMFYDTGTFGYYTEYDTDRYMVNKAQTDINGELTVKVHVPFTEKAIDYTTMDSYNNNVSYTIFDLHGHGIFKFTATVVNKIIAQEDIGVSGTISNNFYTLTIDCEGEII